MGDKHLSTDEFFDRLGKLLETKQQKGHGSVFLTQKRLSPREDDSKSGLARSDSVQDFADLHPSEPLPLIVRATDGKSQSADRKKNKSKVKLSTVVQPDDIETFFTRYAETCRANMQSLRKRDRSKRKKTKKAKKADTAEETAS